PLYQGPPSQPAAERHCQKGLSADHRRRRALASGSADILPLRGTLLETQDLERRRTEKMLHRGPDSEAPRKWPRRLSFSLVGRRAVSANGTPLLVVEGLKKYYPVRGGVFGAKIGDVRAVDGVALSVMEGETLGLVGESG